MNNRTRIIPTLLIGHGNLYKTKKFSKPNYLGDPINAIKIFNEKGVDELCVLDIFASKENSSPDFDLLKDMASESFMPLSYGGGIKTFEECKKIISLGYEKVVLNTSFINNQKLVEEVSSYFGRQSVVVSIDYKSNFLSSKCYCNDGEIKTDYTPIDLAQIAQEKGAGELLLYSMDRDGMKSGYDKETIKKVVEKVNIPVIACGGASSIDDIAEVIEDTKVSAVAAGSMFVYFGKRDAVLINFPSEEEFIAKGVYK